MRIFLLLLLATCCGLHAETAQSLFESGNQAYAAEDYAAAAAAYAQALEQGQSAALHTNLGNAFLSQNRYGPAILHYKKALALQPRSDAAQAGLSLAWERANLPPYPVPWIFRYAALMSVGSWLWLAVVCFWALALILLLSRYVGWQGIIKRSVVAALFIVLLAAMAGLTGWHFQSTQGVILTSEAPVKVSPTQTSPVAAYLPEGIIARVVDRHGDYYKIDDGKDRSGWISANDFAPIWE